MTRETGIAGVYVYGPRARAVMPGPRLSWRHVLLVTLCVAAGVALSACGDDDNFGRGAPPAPAIGPVISFFGITRADDSLIDPSAATADGIPIFIRPVTIPGAASGFSIVVEGRPGASGIAVGNSAFQEDLSSFPDLQIQVSRPLGNGSSEVCDDPLLVDVPGGVPAISPVDFRESPANIAKINDLACRFQDGLGNPVARTASGDSCVTFASGEFAFVDATTTAQFCGAVNVPLAFPAGDTVVTARLRDTAGNAGPRRQIIIRVR